MSNTNTILVTGATGMQGGATVDALLEAGFTVRALVRDPASAAAQALAARGVELARGDFEDKASLAAALKGVRGVFSMQNPPMPDDPDSEVRTGRNLIEAARGAGVEIFVHTSVARAGDQENFVDWAEGRWWPGYWNSKSAVNDLVKAAGFPHWVILKPAYMLENFTQSKAVWMYPGLVDGVIETAMEPSAKLHVLSATDVGRFAAAAFAEPARFDRQELELAAEALTMGEIAEVLTKATGKPVVSRYLTEAELVAKGYHAGLASSQVWASIEGYKVDLAAAASHGIVLEKLADWAPRHRDKIVINN